MIPTKNEMYSALALRQGEELTEKMKQSTVAVCGLGGLGSNIAISLARAGVGRLILIDFDSVDITNLHRQQYKASQIGQLKTDAMRENLAEISPYTEILTHCVKLDENNAPINLSCADIICEAFDSVEAKSMLVDVCAEKLSDKYLVASSGMAGLGSPNSIKTRRITKNFYLCGDGESDVNTCGSLVSARVMLCAAHASTIVLRLIAGMTDI